VTRTLGWLDEQVRGAWCTPVDGFGVAELAMVTALEWLEIRGGVGLQAFARLQAFVAAHASRASLASTRPPAG
jgi:glutathione S-transferase